MSRYTVTLATHICTDTEAVIGYDPPLRTYFVQAFPDPETEHPAVWFGTRPEQFPMLPQLLDALSGFGCAIIAGLTDEIVAAMAEEAAGPHEKSVAERYGLLKY